MTPIVPCLAYQPGTCSVVFPQPEWWWLCAVVFTWGKFSFLKTESVNSLLIHLLFSKVWMLAFFSLWGRPCHGLFLDLSFPIPAAFTFSMGGWIIWTVIYTWSQVFREMGTLWWVGFSPFMSWTRKQTYSGSHSCSGQNKWHPTCKLFFACACVWDSSPWKWFKFCTEMKKCGPLGFWMFYPCFVSLLS